MLHIVCFSGGYSSAVVGASVANRYDDVILLNHDISPNVEAEPIKKFKRDVAAEIGLEITYANHPKWEEMDQFDVCVEAQAFKVNGNNALCTSRLKTEPFNKFLKDLGHKDVVIYYGFDADETSRITRRSQILGTMGYDTDYPLATWWPMYIKRLETPRPCTYGVWKHGNCVGCLKAKKQHWYCVFIYRPDIWEKAKWAEEQIGHSILKECFLDELEVDFMRFRDAGVVATEHCEPVRFWIEAKKRLAARESGQISWGWYENDVDQKPCDCVF